MYYRYLYLCLLWTISGMDYTSCRGKSSTRGRWRERRSFSEHPTAMDTGSPFFQTPYMSGALETIPILFRMFLWGRYVLICHTPLLCHSLANNLHITLQATQLLPPLAPPLPSPSILTPTSPNKMLELEVLIRNLVREAPKQKTVIAPDGNGYVNYCYVLVIATI